MGTTHLSYTNRFRITAARKKEANKLIKIIKNKNKNKNFIFTGDLNSTPNSSIVKNLSKYLKNAGPDFKENTWTTKPFQFGNFQESKLNWRLDYIFTTKDIKVNKAKIVSSVYSDHLPVLIEIEV